jgi:hypothetical protein
MLGFAHIEWISQSIPPLIQEYGACFTDKYTKADRDKQAEIITGGKQPDGADNMDEV